MKAVAYDTDGSIVRYQLRGEDQIFPGICGLIFHENPIFREAFINEILFHGRRFRAWFIAALTAGDNEDSIWIFKGRCVCTALSDGSVLPFGEVRP